MKKRKSKLHPVIKLKNAIAPFIAKHFARALFYVIALSIISLVSFIYASRLKIFVEYRQSKHEEVSETNQLVIHIVPKTVDTVPPQEDSHQEAHEIAKQPKTGQPGEVTVRYNYLQPGEQVPQIDPALFSTNSRNPVIRIYSKVAIETQLQRELDCLPPLDFMLLRPISMNLQCPSNISEENALQMIEKDLDNNLARLKKMLADNPIGRKLAYAR